MTARIEPVDRQCWLEWAPKFHDYSYRQLWDFGLACARRLGASSEHVAIRCGGQMLGLADVRVKRLPLMRAGIAYMTGAPLVRQAGQADAVRLRACLQALSEEYVKRRRLVLRIVPPLGTPDWNAVQAEVFRQAGFVTADHWPGYRTLLVPIDRPLDQVRGNLTQKWRNCLNRAERNGLTIRSGTDPELLEGFCRLFRELLERKQFTVDLHADFYATVQQHLCEQERFHISLAQADGRTVAGHVASILGDTCVYLLGATNDEGIRSKSSYVLQWHAIQLAQQRGCRWCDLGGIDPDGNPGVYHFKQGLNGLDVSAPGPFEMEPRGLNRYVVRGCERAYRSVRRLKPVGR